MNDDEFIPRSLVELKCYINIVCKFKDMGKDYKEAMELLQVMAEQDILNKICKN